VPSSRLLTVERSSRPGLRAGSSGAIKVGLVSHYMPPHHGGIERVADTLFNGYQQRGLDVRWVASRVPRNAPAVEGRRLRVACWNGLESRLGVPVPVWGVAGVRQLSELIRWADVLHAHDCLYPGSALTVVLSRRQSRPVLLSQHIGFTRYRSTGLNAIQRLAYATLGRAVLRRVAHLVLVTPRAAEYIPRLLGRTPPSTSIIQNGIDTARFRPATGAERRKARADLGLAHDDAVVLFTGRLVANKGLEIVLEASARLAGARFLIVGDGPLRDRLCGRPESVLWRADVSPDRMPSIYHAADCLALPSVDEGLPLVVQEAMACGLPVVASEGERYATDLHEHGVCLLAHRTGESLAARLHEVLTGQVSIVGARAHAEKHWGLDTMVDAYIDQLRQLVDTGRPRG